MQQNRNLKRVSLRPSVRPVGLPTKSTLEAAALQQVFSPAVAEKLKTIRVTFEAMTKLMSRLNLLPQAS